MIRNDVNVTFNSKWFHEKLQAEAQNAVSRLPSVGTDPLSSVDEDELDRNKLKDFYGEGTKQYEIVLDVYQLILEIIQTLLPKTEIISIRHAYRQLLGFEWLAQVELDNKRYRDHITHPAKVATLGLWFLYDENIFVSPIILPILKDTTKNYRIKHNIIIPNWDHFLKQLWLVTGIFHDFCYPVEFLLKQCHKINSSNSYRIWSVYQKIRYHLKYILNGLHDSFFLYSIDSKSDIARKKIRSAIKIGKTNQNHLHAVLGALNLLMYCIKNNSLHTEEGLMFQLAASAIFHHHEGKPISFNDHPIDFLLVVCDTLQEWDRDNLIKQSAKGNRWIINNYVECKEVIAALKSASNSIDFTFHTPSLYIRRKTGWKKEIFAEGKEKDLQLFNNHGIFPEIRFKV